MEPEDTDVGCGSPSSADNPRLAALPPPPPLEPSDGMTLQLVGDSGAEVGREPEMLSPIICWAVRPDTAPVPVPIPAEIGDDPLLLTRLSVGVLARAAEVDAEEPFEAADEVEALEPFDTEELLLEELFDAAEEDEDEPFDAAEVVTLSSFSKFGIAYPFRV